MKSTPEFDDARHTDCCLFSQQRDGGLISITGVIMIQ